MDAAFNTVNNLGLGITNLIILDGGGSFIFKANGTEVTGTFENRRINTIGVVTPTYSIYDVNRDGVVDGRDIACVMEYYMWRDTDPGWNDDVAKCDINGDGVIDIVDLVLVYANFD